MLSGMVRLKLANLLRPDSRLWCNAGVVRRTNVGIQGKWQTNCQDRCGSEQYELPVSFELQMHEKHHHAQRLCTGYCQYQHHSYRLGHMQHVEEDRQCSTAAQHKEDCQIVDVMSVVSIVGHELTNQKQKCVIKLGDKRNMPACQMM